MLNILIVDDEPLTRKYLKQVLPQICGDLRIAGEAMDGQEAVKILERETVDLLITDVKMPVMNGIELCRWIFNRKLHVRIIILSGYDEFTLAKEAMRYGVQDYLLKPIVENELAETVLRTAAEIRQEKDKELAYRMMQNMSDTSYGMIVQNFLKAIASDSHVEIKSLYPLLFKFKISLIESLGLIMIVSLDEESVIERSLPPRDIPLFKFILHQFTEEIAAGREGTRLFLDKEQNTCILITGDDEQALRSQSLELYSQIANAMRQNTRLSVTGAAGPAENDILQLGSSYREAHILLANRTFHGGGALYCFKEDDAVPAEKISRLDHTVLALHSALADDNDITASLLTKNYSEMMPDYAVSTLYRFAIHMIRQLVRLAGDSAEAEEKAMNRLGASLPYEEKTLNQAEAITVLKSAAAAFAPVSRESLSELDVAGKAKEYIFAHYAEPISLALIAEKIGVSAGYLSGVFHKNTGESYIKFLTRVRMEKAASLLSANPASKIYDVAEKVGFLSAKHFSFVFKQHFHVPPGEYQEKWAKRAPV